MRKLSRFWETLKTGVRNRELPDFLSLKYPPHITLCCSFDMSEDEIQGLNASISEVFRTPFLTNPSKQYVYYSSTIISFVFDWAELSQRIAVLQYKYPKLPWVLDGYHLTLLHHQKMNSEYSNLIPSIERQEKDFNLVVWKHSQISPVKGFSWERRMWRENFRVSLRGRDE